MDAADCRGRGRIDAERCGVYMQAALHDELAAALTERMSAIKVGDGTDPATQMGPCINRQRVEHAAAHVEDAVGRGARVACGGGAPTGLAKGFFFAPTLLVGATADMRVFREETFAPVVPLMRCAPARACCRRRHGPPPVGAFGPLGCAAPPLASGRRNSSLVASVFRPSTPKDTNASLRTGLTARICWRHAEPGSVGCANVRRGPIG